MTLEGAGGRTESAAANFVVLGQNSGKPTSPALYNFDQPGRRHPYGGSTETIVLI